MMLRLLLAPIAILIILLDPENSAVIFLNEKMEMPSKQKLRITRLERKLKSLNPWTRTGKKAKRIAEELLTELKPGPRDTGGAETGSSAQKTSQWQAGPRDTGGPQT